jgi:hypothetical protein
LEIEFQVPAWQGVREIEKIDFSERFVCEAMRKIQTPRKTPILLFCPFSFVITNPHLAVIPQGVRKMVYNFAVMG